MFRFAAETEPDGAVRRIVFLALRGEVERVECFWLAPPENRSKERRNSRGLMQLPLSAGAKHPTRSARPRKRAGTIKPSQRHDRPEAVSVQTSSPPSGRP